MDSSNIRQVANCRSLDSAIYANIKTMQSEIKTARPDLNTYTANQSVYVFAKGQEITLKCVPRSTDRWLCNTQDRNAEKIEDFGELTPEKVIQKIDKLFPKPQ